MERPQSVLIALIATGLAASGFFFGAHQKTVLGKEHRKELATQEKKLTAEIEKRLGEESVSEGQGATTNDLFPPTDATTSEDRLQEQLTFIEGQLDLLRDENARLLSLVDRLETKLKSAGGTGEERNFSAEEEKALTNTQQLTTKSRELDFKTPLEINFTDWEGMAQAVTDSLQPLRTPEQQAKLSRAYAAMGFVPPTTDVTKEITNLLTSQLGAAIYVGDNKVLFNQDGNLLSVHDRTALAVAFNHALQDQNFDLSKVPPPTQTNDDSYAAANALLLGDASIIKLRHMMYDMASANDDLRNSPTALSKDDFSAAPPFIREYFLFPHTAGEMFCQALHETGKWKAVNAGIQNPPTSTAEILHPELYLAEKRFTPESYDWPAEKFKVAGAEPLWNNVAGELGISVFLNRGYYKYNMSQQGFFDTDLPPLTKRDLRESPGSLAAKGWVGDRYLVYPNGDGAGGSDHIYWRSQWASANDAAEFFHGARVTLAYELGIELAESDYQIDSDPAKRTPITPERVGKTYEQATDKDRHLFMQLDETKREVTIVNAANKKWLEALKALEFED
ncbi:MAG: hypothetical protein ACI9UA_001056 [Pseudoalteromonas tetraodonis]|jgi:hypothetical protein